MPQRRACTRKRNRRWNNDIPRYSHSYTHRKNSGHKRKLRRQMLQPCSIERMKCKRDNIARRQLPVRQYTNKCFFSSVASLMPMMLPTTHCSFFFLARENIFQFQMPRLSMQSFVPSIDFSVRQRMTTGRCR